LPLHDATLSLDGGVITFPGDPVFRMEPLTRLEKGDPFNLALLSLGTHCGTHVDPPLHYLKGGAAADELPIDVMIGPGLILDMRGRPFIDRSALAASALADGKRILFKTDNGPGLRRGSLGDTGVHLTEDGAFYLVERGVRLAGIDSLSIEAYKSLDGAVHKILLSAGVLIVEGVDLLDIPPGPCEVFCLPLKIRSADGAPARVLIRTD
jgi:arylformamidase